MIVYGKQVVLYVLEKHPSLIEEVLFSKEIDKKLFSKFSKLGKKIIKIDNKKAQSLAQGGNHQGFFLKLQEFLPCSVDKIKKSNFILVLDGLTDVGNIGAIIRTAYSLGVDGIVISGFKALNYAGVVRTSSGAALDLPLALCQNLYDLPNELKQCGFDLFGACMDGDDLKELKTKNDGKIALFLGNEGEGLSKKLEKKLDKKIAIKMQNEFNSLNVSVAAGILIYNLKR